ncbi:hypothetical protein AMTRI_Chr06g176650 [Amborella trichopoda]
MDNDSGNAIPTDCSFEEGTPKYLTGLSTIMVASIQELKDRISQIEFIFCRQIFPTYQSELKTSRGLQKLLVKDKKDAENEWREKERSLLLLIEDLRNEKQQAQELIQQEKAKLLAKFDTEKEELLKAHEGEKHALFTRLDKLENIGEVEELQRQLQLKIEELTKLRAKHDLLMTDLKCKGLAKEWLENFLRVDKEAQEQIQKEKEKLGKLFLNKKEKWIKTEKSQLLGRLEKLENGGELSQLREKLCLKEVEVIQLKKMNQKLAEDLKSNDNEQRIIDMHLDNCRDQLKSTKEISEGKLINERREKACVIQEFELLKKKYISLHSQHKFLRGKLGLSLDKRHNMNVGRESSIHPRQENLPDDAGQNPSTAPLSPQLDKPEKNGDAEIEPKTCMEPKKIRTPETAPGFNSEKISPVAPTESSSSRALKRPFISKIESHSGLKRSNSSWRDTRACQELKEKGDPHDDFLDTPMEMVHMNLNKEPTNGLEPKTERGGAQLIAVPPLNDMDFDNSDEDETQEFDSNSSKELKACEDPKLEPKKNSSTTTRELNRGYKYVEPVRKKEEREALKGAECNQCKKFYDAILPNGNSDIVRCEHRDVGSRHRYRYAPPSTPEGFWNIGFDSVMEN